MTSPAARLREARRLAGHANATEAAAQFGWTVPTYLAHENGTRGFAREVARYAKAFNVDAGWLLTGLAAAAPRTKKTAPPPPGWTRVPEYDVAASAGSGRIISRAQVIGEYIWPLEFLQERKYSALGNLAMITLVGDSMEPTFRAGQKLLLDTGHTTPSPAGIYALWDGFGLVVKRIQGAPNGKLRIIADNPAYPPYEAAAKEVEIKGRVLGAWMWV